MEPGSALALNIVLAAVALVGAVIAIWQAMDARRSRAAAEQALALTNQAAEAAERQAIAAEKLLRLEEANQEDPWRTEDDGPGVTACINDSDDVIEVTSVVPVIVAEHLEFEGVAVDGMYAPGDSFTIRTGDRRSSAAVTISWRREGDSRIRWTLLHI